MRLQAREKRKHRAKFVPTFLLEWVQKWETPREEQSRQQLMCDKEWKIFMLHVVAVYAIFPRRIVVYIQGSMIFTWISVDRFTRR